MPAYWGPGAGGPTPPSDKGGDVEVVDERALELAMALSDDSFSVDEALQWGFVRPSALWRILHAAVDSGVIAEGADEGQFAWRDQERRCAIILAAPLDQWRAVLAHPTLATRTCDQALAAVHRRRSDLAEALYRAIVLAARPEDCPAGGGGWVRMVVGSIRLFRDVKWRTREVLDRAIDTAVAGGDLRSQATLLATRAWEAERCGEAAAAEDFDHAREAAAAIGDPHLTREVNVLAAISLVYAGKPLQAIAVFEEYLGDVPDDTAAVPTEGTIEPPPVAEALFGPIAMAYAVAGQAPRAIDIAYRMLDRGVTHHRPPLVHLAEVTLAHVYLTLRHLDGVREQAANAYAYWTTEGTQPVYVWLSAVALAWVRMCENQPQEAIALLDAAHVARSAAGTRVYWGSALFEVLLWLEQKGLAPAGMTLEGELATLLDTPNPGMHAVAHRFRALLHVRAAEDGDVGAIEVVDAHLAESERLLRGVGLVPELVRVLHERARWQELCGRFDEAAKAREEANEILERIDPDARCCSALGFIRAVIETGRLTSLRPGEATWGELTARLCAALRVERAAMVEEGEPPQVLAARGGDEAWIAAVRDVVARKPPVETGVIPPPRQELLPGVDARAALVRFVAQGSGRRGALVVENRHSRWLVDKQDPHLLGILSWQLGVILDNLALHQELVDVRRQLEQETRYYREHGAASRRADAIIGGSAAIRRVHDDVARVAVTDTTVLLLGETGVGKELFAREVHSQSSRRDAPFVAVHIAALASGLVASALFGHERGAFTGAVSQTQGRFELANRGTLFLDEIGELGTEEQVRLLRVLQEGTFERVGGNRTLRSDFRLIVATNRELEAEVRGGRFRQDLYYRLNVFPIRVPPLRERVGDIPPMALFFMERAARRLGRSFEGISQEDMERLMAYSWPGNVRELEHVIERAAVLSDGPRLRIPPLASVLEPPTGDEQNVEQPGWVSLAEAERRYVRRVLRHVRGRVTGAGGAAEILGLKPSTLNFRIRKLGLADDLAQARGRE
jgi:transcriptional regulator with GAF, ATPase, and Fis domain